MPKQFVQPIVQWSEGKSGKHQQKDLRRVGFVVGGEQAEKRQKNGKNGWNLWDLGKGKFGGND
jgi:hypothetical protein